MRLVTVDELNEGMVLAKNLYDHNNNILLREGCKNVKRFKSRLKRMGIEELYINDGISENIDIKTVTGEKKVQKNKEMIKDIMNNVRTSKDIDYDEVSNNIEDLIKDISNNKDVVINLHDVRSKDAYTFGHSVNTSVLAIKIGISCGYNKEQLLQLGTGAILHDIGKTKIPDSILKKKSKLTDEEYEKIKSHSLLGYNLIKDVFSISSQSAHIVKHHHEKVDGSGYPDGLKGDQIHDFAKITGVVDVFDALTSNRHYRNRWSNKKALNMITSNSGTEFSQNVVLELMNNIALYPNGTKIDLSNGKEAIVKEQNENNPDKPIVKIKNKDGFKEINLLNRKDLIISS